METLHRFVQLFLHLDVFLSQVVAEYGTWTYLLLFGIIFCETGLVVTPFLPGDSLLFTAGALAAATSLNLWAVLGLLSFAAILGDNVNYWIGRAVGPKVFTQGHRLLNPEHLERTHRFYEKYGGKTVIMARFVPIVRTFSPFVAGVGSMTYARFLAYDVFGGVLWISVCALSGYFFGNLPFVRKNFSLVILGVIFVSILPGIIEYLRHRRASLPPK